MTVSLTRANADQVSPVQYQGHLVLFTAFYEQRGYAPYIHSLAVTGMVLERLGISWDYWPSAGDFHIERAVNLALSRFVRDEKATDFLCIDADESWEADGLLRLLMRPDDVVGAIYKMKNRWDQWTGTWKTVNGIPDGKLQDGTPMIAAQGLPFGFLRLKKAPLIAYQEAHPDLWYWDGEEKVTQFVSTGIRDHHFYSQDINFCVELTELGFPLWIEPNVTIGHCGIVEHIGNFDKYLVELKQEQTAQAEKNAAMQNIEAFAKQVTEAA